MSKEIDRATADDILLKTLRITAMIFPPEVSGNHEAQWLGMENIPLYQRRYLLGPIYVGNEGTWGDTLPQNVKDGIPAERLAIVRGEQPDWMIGPAEIVAAMYAATMSAPLPHDYTELYIWAASKMLEARTGHPMPGENNLRPSDDDVLKPKGRLHGIYRDSAEKIKRAVVNAQIGREQQARAAMKDAREKAESSP